jgi:hypothetical protein
MLNIQFFGRHIHELGEVICEFVGWDSAVGIMTLYGLDSLGIESQWGRDFPHPSRPALGPTQPPKQWVPGLSQGQSGRGRGIDHPPHLAPRLRKE